MDKAIPNYCPSVQSDSLNNQLGTLAGHGDGGWVEFTPTEGTQAHNNKIKPISEENTENGPRTNKGNNSF